MSVSDTGKAVIMVLIQALISGCLSQSYKDLEALNINCPSRDRCLGYGNNLTYMERSCECDFNCTAYQDCCIDALPSEQPARTDVTCLHYGEGQHTGVYVISKCSSNWNGPKEVREKCVGRNDLSDPLSAVPVTDVAQKETYRNFACAVCNNANSDGMRIFRFNVKCPEVKGIPKHQIISSLSYNQERQSWGINRLNRFGNETEFFGCDIVFDVPWYLNNSVRFCRPNLISKCATNWNHPTTAKLCAQYMAVVYSNAHSYRNPHCAICNHKTSDEVSCRNKYLGRQKRARRPIFTIPSYFSGNIVENKTLATSECPSGQIYDPFLKICRKLACAQPGLSFVNGRCVRRGTLATSECPSGQVYDVFFKICRKLTCALPGHSVVNGRCVRRRTLLTH